MSRLIIAGFMSLCSLSVFAQLSISNGEHIMEFSGFVSTYYNAKWLKPGNTDYGDNRFKLRDAQFQIEGHSKDLYEYSVQVDFADMAAMYSGGEIDPENPGLMNAFVLYKGLKFIDIRMGYGKVYYSRASLVPFAYSPFWQRAELVRGDIFSRRDIGVTLIKDLFRQRVMLYGGIYTGLGEIGLRGNNDESGKPEFTGRAEFSYPARYRYREIDTRHVPVPMITLGVNGRYANKQLPQGASLPANSQGEYGLKVINGEKLTYGFDVAAQYLGFSAQFEYDRIRSSPHNPKDALFQGLKPDVTGGLFYTSGYVTQLNYFFKRIHTIASMRYEVLDLNDLVPGHSERVSAALAYQLDGFDSMIKLQYFDILQEESIDTKKWTEQVRIGWQYQFH